MSDVFKFNSSVKNISGDESANLVLGWHGGCPVPFAVGQTNFKYDGPGVKKMDVGFYGNGMYFSQFLNYGDLYHKKKEEGFGNKKLPVGTPIILSWIIMGKYYIIM